MKTNPWRASAIAIAIAVTALFPLAAQAADDTAALRKEVGPATAGLSGRALFDSTCVACHGADGTGTMPGVPDLTGAGGPLTQPDGVLIRRMLDGFQSPGSPMAMPPKGGNPGLTERDAAKLVDYMRSTFKP